MSSLKKLNLKENPFQFLTPTFGMADEQAEPIWAGMHQVKDKISYVYKNTVKNVPRQVVLNWGPWGGGKTFAAYYFIKTFNADIAITQTYIVSPKEGSKAAREFISALINDLRFSSIQDQVRLLQEKMGETEFISFIENKIRDEVISRAISLIGSEDEDISTLIRRYLFSGLTKTELAKTGLYKNIETNTDRIKLIAGLILCFIGDQRSYSGRFILWIDEMEDLIYYSQKEYRAFSQLLRDLINSLNEHFTVFMNFTLAEPEESTIELLLGNALWSRITRKIRFKEFSLEGGLEYCQELLNHYQIDKTEEYSPFTKEAILLTFELIPDHSLTPREINRYCGELINFAIDGNKTLIDPELVTKYFNLISEDE